MDDENLTEVPGLGKASKCTASGTHDPVPLRFVWHHVMPQEAGGQTVAVNLVQICDSCHYSIHRLMWNLAQGLPIGRVPRQQQLAYAKTGYEACVAAGTVALIPDEGLARV